MQLREPESVEVGKKKVIKKDTKTIKMKEPNNNLKKSSTSTKVTINNNNTTAIPSIVKSIKNTRKVKESTNTIENKTDKEKKKSVITTSLHTNTEKSHINTDSNNDKENHGVNNFRKKITKYHSKYHIIYPILILILILLRLIGKLKNITSMSARDAFKLALAWKTYVTEKIGLLDDDDMADAVKEEVYNNPVPNISINSIDTIANELNCSKTLMRGAFFNVITNIKELSTTAILEDGRIKVSFYL